MTDEKTPLDQALELLVYAPIGLAITAREELPRFIERGRSQVTGQLAMAKMIGQFAVAQGQREAEKVVKQAAERLEDLGVGGRSAPAPAARPAPAAATATATTNGASAPASGTVLSSDKGPRPGAASTPTTAASTNDDHLAIPGYDALSASQVVTRLAGLSSDELEAVRAYEAGARGRKTILHRIGQLQSGSTA